MDKSTVIFSEKEIKKPQKVASASDAPVSLSKSEYRHIIETAYNEGKKDALKKKKRKSLKQDERKDAEVEGKEEAIKQHAKEKEQNLQRFNTITARQDIELLRAQSVFPFTIFPDTIVIDTTKVTISKKQLFATEFITTVPLKDLSDVNVQTYLFLGAVMIQYMPHTESPGTTGPIKVRISNLDRGAAIKVKNILKGALVAKAEEIDIAALSPKEIEEVLHKFGESEGVL